jgi:hypothetical protein
MWHMDPELWKELEKIRELVSLKYKDPTKEWPLVFVEEFDQLLVVREWPGGHITAYSTSEYSEEIRKGLPRDNR